MVGWVADIGNLTIENTDFRRVVVTGRHSQLTVMSIKPGEDAGKEIHLGLDEFIHVRAGTALVSIGKSAEEIEEEYRLSKGWSAFVPGGYWYNIANTGSADLKLYTFCAPAAHRDGAVYATRAQADQAETNEELREKLERGYAEAEGFGA